jgi:hypothetical protein
MESQNLHNNIPKVRARDRAIPRTMKPFSFVEKIHIFTTTLWDEMKTKAKLFPVVEK